MQRVKDLEKFLAELERPLAQGPEKRTVVTDADLERDGQSFLAFASAFGVRPPRAGSPTEEESVVPSAQPP